MIDLSKIEQAIHLDELEKIRVELLGKNGIITKEFKKMKEAGVLGAKPLDPTPKKA